MARFRRVANHADSQRHCEPSGGAVCGGGEFYGSNAGVPNPQRLHLDLRGSDQQHWRIEQCGVGHSPRALVWRGGVCKGASWRFQRAGNRVASSAARGVCHCHHVLLGGAPPWGNLHQQPFCRQCNHPPKSGLHHLSWRVSAWERAAWRSGRSDSVPQGT